MTIRLSAALPNTEQHDGLSTYADDYIDQPERVRVVVLHVDTRQIVTNVDQRDDVPTLRIRWAELIDDADDARAVALAANRARDSRLGVSALYTDDTTEDGDVVDGETVEVES